MTGQLGTVDSVEPSGSEVLPQSETYQKARESLKGYADHLEGFEDRVGVTSTADMLRICRSADLSGAEKTVLLYNIDALARRLTGNSSEEVTYERAKNVLEALIVGRGANYDVVGGMTDEEILSVVFPGRPSTANG